MSRGSTYHEAGHTQPEAVTHSVTEEKAFKEPVPPPDFWPTNLMAEYQIAVAIRDLIDPNSGELDAYVANSVINYGLKLQAISGNGAELMARMRLALEKARGVAIMEAMTDAQFQAGKPSATMQKAFVDSKLAVYEAGYTYAEFLSKRLSYAMDYVRSLLSYLKEEMRQAQAIPQR